MWCRKVYNNYKHQGRLSDDLVQLLATRATWVPSGMAGCVASTSLCKILKPAAVLPLSEPGLSSLEAAGVGAWSPKSGVLHFGPAQLQGDGAGSSSLALRCYWFPIEV